MTEENGLSCPLRFYNMLVHLRTGSRPAEENVAVKNIWQKDNLVFMDLYFYRSKKSQVIDSVYVKDIFDLSTEKFYASPELFFAITVRLFPLRAARRKANSPKRRSLISSIWNR